MTDEVTKEVVRNDLKPLHCKVLLNAFGIGQKAPRLQKPTPKKKPDKFLGIIKYIDTK